MTYHKQPLWSRSVAASLAMSMGMEAAGCSGSEPARIIEQARIWRDKGDLRAAIVELKQLVDQDGQHRAACVLLGELLIDQGDLEGATDALRRALALGDDDGSAELLLGRTLLMRGEHERLLAELPATGSGQRRACLLGMRAQAMLGLLNPDDARSLAMQALQLHAESPQALLVLARLAVSLEQLASARGYIRRALGAAPGDIACLRFHADLARAAAEPEAAFATCSAILERHPCNAQALLDLAHVHTDAARGEAAQGCIRQARKLAGAIPALLFAEALVHYQLKQTAQADDLVQRVLRAAPDHSPSLLLAAAIKLGTHAHAAAEQLLQKFLRAHPGHVLGSKLMAEVHLENQHPQAALALLAPLMASGRKDRELLAMAAIASLRARDYTSASSLFCAAAQCPPAPTPCIRALTLSRMGDGDYPRQLAALEKLIGARRAQPSHGLLEASTLLLDGQRAAAMALLRTLEQDDDNPLVQTMLGEMLLHQDPRCARNCLARALLLDPAYLPALDHLRQLDADEQKPHDLTRNRYLAALAAAPANSAVMENLSRLALAHQHPAEAVSWMERACAEHPGDLDLALKTGALYLQLDMVAQAASLAASLHAGHPDSAAVIRLLGQARLASADQEGACAAFARLAALEPDQGAPWLHLAMAHLAQEQDTSALVALKKALLIEPGLFEARSALVALLIRHSRFNEALSAAAAGQRLAAEDGRAHALEGDVHAAQGMYRLASQAWERAFELAPSGALLTLLHGALTRQGRQVEAAARMTSWLASHTDDVPTRLYLAAHHLAQRSLKEAASQLEAVLLHAPDHLPALNDLAWICQQLRDGRALALAQRAHALAPDNPTVMDTLGWIHQEQGELARALPLLQKASSLAPEAGEIHLHLGSLLAQTGDRDGARRALEKALVSTVPFEHRADASSLLASLQRT